jgi:hypothetical protein
VTHEPGYSGCVDRTILRGFDDVSTLTGEPRLLYLAHLFRGRYLHHCNDLNEAKRSYLAATAVLPGAWTARLGVAAIDFGSAVTPAGEVIRSSSVLISDHTHDPWASYRYGDFWLLSARIAGVRTLLKAGS